MPRKPTKNYSVSRILRYLKSARRHRRLSAISGVMRLRADLNSGSLGKYTSAWATGRASATGSSGGTSRAGSGSAYSPSASASSPSRGAKLGSGSAAWAGFSSLDFFLAGFLGEAGCDLCKLLDDGVDGPRSALVDRPQECHFKIDALGEALADGVLRGL